MDDLENLLEEMERYPPLEMIRDDTLLIVEQQSIWEDAKENPKTLPNTHLEQDDVSRKQRADRGFSSRDLWSLDYYLSHWLPEALRRLKTSGHPGAICVKYKCAYCGCAETPEGNWLPSDHTAPCPCKKTWIDILETIAESFEINLKMHNTDYEFGSPEFKVAQKKIWKGRKLLIKWFDALWD